MQAAIYRSPSPQPPRPSSTLLRQAHEQKPEAGAFLHEWCGVILAWGAGPHPRRYALALSRRVRARPGGPAPALAPGAASRVLVPLPFSRQLPGLGLHRGG